ncbi:hypothetical protein GCM10008955_30320 [Deinococcus malanensis]|uniref:Uncharacterized protein n=1 Tax=Deinococcus malanensis TaxID=1706855 RepID=A0ABQ2EYY8_9DEIO|nr:hypothetical protein GCM10008955_30320 [Deinococcus malanensis]
MSNLKRWTTLRWVTRWSARHAWLGSLAVEHPGAPCASVDEEIRAEAGEVLLREDSGEWPLAGVPSKLLSFSKM